ncbi:MAG: YidH family protein [Ktedonobacterales bacterium]
MMDEERAKESTTSNAVRDHLANKRTMLAWCRTAIAVIALGFVVARFGLLLRELAPLVPRHIPEGTSTVFGTLLVAAGGVLSILAMVDYLRTGRDIDRNTYRWSPVLEIALSLVLVLASVILAVYLVVTG